MFTRTRAAAGSKLREVKSLDQVIQEPRDTAPRLPEGGESREKAAVHPHLPLAVPVGSLGRRVLEVRRAAGEEVAGAAADVVAGEATSESSKWLTLP